MTVTMDTLQLLHVEAGVAEEEESNDTLEDQLWDLSFNVHGTIILMYIPGIIYCNSLVFWSIILYPGFYTSHNMLLLSLSVGDLLVGFARIPLTALKIAPSTAHLIEGNRYSCFTYEFFRDISTNGSLHSLFFMGIDSYGAVAFPFFYARTVSVGRTIKALAGMWVFLLIMTVLGLSSHDDTLKFSYFTDDKCGSISLHSTWYIFWIGFLSPFVCIVVPVFLYIHIFIIACRHRRAIKRLNIRRRSGRITIDLSLFGIRMSGAKMSSARTIIFILLWMPYLSAILYIHTHHSQMSPKQMQYLWDVTASFIYVSHMISALVYSIGGEEYRVVYKLMSVTAPWKWKKELRRLYIERMSALYAKRSFLHRRSARASSRCVSFQSQPVKSSIKSSIKSSMDSSAAKSITKIKNMSIETELEQKESNEAIPHGTWL